MDVSVRCTSLLFGYLFSTNIARRCRLVRVCGSLTLIAIIFSQSLGRIFHRQKEMKYRGKK
jgi:hypothetical protein